jgi:hypothetical protein
MSQIALWASGGVALLRLEWGDSNPMLPAEGGQLIPTRGMMALWIAMSLSDHNLCQNMAASDRGFHGVAQGV